MQEHADRVRELAGLAGRFVVAVVRVTRLAWNVDTGDEFARGQGRLEHTDNEVLDWNATFARAALDHHRGTERRQGRNPVRRRIGMHDAAANGAPIAHRAISNSRRYLAQSTVGRVWHAAVLDVGMRNAASEHDRTGRFLDALKLGDGGNVDDEVGLDQPQIKHRSERLPAGKKFDDRVLAPAKRER